MIPYGYSMVDMGGIDLAEANCTIVDGIYNKIVLAVNSCGEAVLYNWKFCGIEIAPSYCEIVAGVDEDSDKIFINELIQVTELDEVTVLGIDPPPPPLEPVIPLTATENGVYEISAPQSGYNPVTVSVPPPVIVPKSIDDNGTYYIPEGVDGFNPVTVNVTGGSPWPSLYVENYMDAVKYQGGYEYKGYVYETQFATDCGLVLLADASNGADSVQLSESIANFSGVVLQGIYNRQRTSSYNTTLLYLPPSLNTQYWAGMKDRNNSYTCYVTFTSNTEATLSGNKQVLIYGIP